jgi:epoxide hydrolase-like predicted phosphatase
MSYEAVIFDFGGVLLRMDPWIFAPLEERYGLEQGSLLRALYRVPEWRALERGQGTREAWEQAVQRALSEMAGCDMTRCYLELKALERPLNQEMVELARGLRSGYRVAILSNSDDSLEDRLRDRFGIYDLFHHVFNSYRLRMAKPDPEIYLHAAQTMGLSPSACVFIDDLRRNVDGARDVGMYGIHFTGDMEALTRELRGCGIPC